MLYHITVGILTKKKKHHTDILIVFPCTEYSDDLPCQLIICCVAHPSYPSFSVLPLTKHNLLLEFKDVLKKSLSILAQTEIRRHCTTDSNIKQIIVIVSPTLSPAHDNLLLLLLVGHGVEELLELLLGHLLPQLARLRQHDQPVFHLDRARLLDHPDAAQSVHGLGVQDLVQDAASCFGCVGDKEEKESVFFSW